MTVHLIRTAKRMRRRLKRLKTVIHAMKDNMGFSVPNFCTTLVTCIFSHLLHPHDSMYFWEPKPERNAASVHVCAHIHTYI